MNQNQVFMRAMSFLGLCKRAGRVTSGVDAAVDEIRNGKAELVLLDESASPNARKKVCDACDTHQVHLYLLPEGEIGHAIGQVDRMAVSLPRDGMTDKLLQLLKQSVDSVSELSPNQSGHSYSNLSGGNEVDD